MKVTWSKVIDVPESYWDYAEKAPPIVNYVGELVGCVRAFGETRLVVVLDSGEFKEIGIDQVRRYGN